MIVQCPNCNTQYSFEDSRLTRDLKVRCTRCRHVFILSYQDPAKISAEQNEQPGKGEPQDTDKAMSRETDDIRNLRAEIMGDEMTEGKQPGVSRNMKVLLLLLALALIIGISLYITLPRIAEYVDIPYFSPGPEQGELSYKEILLQDEVKEIYLENIRQYFVSNHEAGQLFVIEGRAVNSFDTPRSMIRIRASLSDEHGEALREKEFVCGNIVSIHQLQSSSREDLEAALFSGPGALSNNQIIMPGESVPFMTVFENPPGEVQEFGLEVMGAQLPSE